MLAKKRWKSKILIVIADFVCYNILGNLLKTNFRTIKMNAFEKVIHLLQYQVAVPKLYGSFHMLFLLLTLVMAVMLVAVVKKGGDRAYRKAMLILWVIIACFEVVRELIFSMHVSGGVATWDYAWFIFPFQLCATPLYIFPLAALLPEGRVRRACMMYLSTYALFGGLVVMLYPGDVVTYFLTINIQGLLHHGIQLVGGIITVVHNRENHTLKNLYKGAIVFSVLVGVALVLNVTVHSYLVANGMGDVFNMFFISPYFPCTLPILSSIYPLVPYPVFLIVYILGFTAIAALMIGLSRLILLAKEALLSKWKNLKNA